MRFFKWWPVSWFVTSALNISDDVIVLGKTQVFWKFAEVNLTLNKKELEFNKKASHFLVLCSQGKDFPLTPRRWKPSEIPNQQQWPVVWEASWEWPHTVQSSTQISVTPQNCYESWQIKKNAKFQWSEQHEQSFNKIKELLANAKVMAYFDSNKETELVADASLSAILMQNTPEKRRQTITAHRNGKYITHNVSHFKVVEWTQCFMQGESRMVRKNKVMI